MTNTDSTESLKNKQYRIRAVAAQVRIDGRVVDAIGFFIDEPAKGDLAGLPEGLPEAALEGDGCLALIYPPGFEPTGTVTGSSVIKSMPSFLEQGCPPEEAIQRTMLVECVDCGYAAVATACLKSEDPEHPDFSVTAAVDRRRFTEEEPIPGRDVVLL